MRHILFFVLLATQKFPPRLGGVKGTEFFKFGEERRGTYAYDA